MPAAKVPSEAWTWWESLGAPRTVLAPMVGQSERAFRHLSRRYGADLCVTPMVHARMFTTCDRYRKEVLADLSGGSADRPLVVQLCGDDKDVVLAAATACAPFCDAVDLNLGCPQGIAKRGHYGAFLLTEPDLVCAIISHLSRNLPVPVTAKIRLLDRHDPAPTIALAARIIESGASALTLHGRTKEMRAHAVDECCWPVIRQVFDALDRSVPLLANGGMESHADLAACLEATGADAAMSSEGALEDPTIFSGARAPPLDLADQYLALAEENSPVLADARGHFHKLLFELVQAPGRETFRSRLVEAKDWAAFKAILADLRADAGAEEAARPRDPKLSWYRRHRRAAADAAARADAEAAEAARRRADPTDNEDAGVAGLFGGGDDDDY